MGEKIGTRLIGYMEKVRRKEIVSARKDAFSKCANDLAY